MFITLTDFDTNNKIFINTSKIIFFRNTVRATWDRTYISFAEEMWLIVKETPSEIIELIALETILGRHKN